MEKHLKLARRTIVVLAVMTLALMWHGWNQSREFDALMKACAKVPAVTQALK